eukprot:gnl/TRDRNA2_/TRDRNA2_40601_c0_seq1.p1 gnl/TRDRNA2_/TRDRNA2_40601_c0~~gnl/TRDRNA2_/TRDRNA2_40601_c0_seq1.p1  ORF type:complete len:198 (-),score=24.85 gnl/TRDRNA2_/TRDRNA2_40601_c0_seq1:87-680(-)
MSWLLRTLQRWPFPAGVGISCVKTSAADLLVQCTVEDSESIDWRRNAVFATFGAVYLGGFQYFLYNRLFVRWFPSCGAFAVLPLRQKLADRSGQAMVASQVALDQFVHIPCIYFPCFYVLKTAIEAGEVSIERSRAAINSYLQVAWSDNLAQWGFFLPAAACNFGFSPLWLRVPVVAGVSFLWTLVLSYRRGRRIES